MDNKTNFNSDSVNLLLTTSMDSYNEEHNRTQIIDSKSNISLPIVSAFVLTVVHAMNYKQIVSLPTDSFSKWLIPFLLFTTYSISLLAGTCSAFFMTRVIMMRDYKVIKARDLYNEDYLKNDVVPYSIAMIGLYIQASEFNKIQNDKRVNWYKIGWRLAFCSLLAYVLYFVLNSIII